jgi:hypothetical protein
MNTSVQSCISWGARARLILLGRELAGRHDPVLVVQCELDGYVLGLGTEQGGDSIGLPAVDIVDTSVGGRKDPGRLPRVGRDDQVVNPGFDSLIAVRREYWKKGKYIQIVDENSALSSHGESPNRGLKGAV